ncbi:MAG: putative O-methyltransferase [Clostridiales bacterium]|jgi:predicted O-methyltransferase YrrM|nr:putative O-methyltransferase [Clostridiales bacterium]
MIVNEQITAYINSLEPEQSKQLSEMRVYARENFIPILKMETQSLLEVTLIMNKPKNILEIGTAIGYSSILMSGCISEDTRITTIERSKPMIEQATKNIKLAGKEEQISLLQGDATDILQQLVEEDRKYDFIFMDAAKGQYITFFEPCMKMLMKEGTLFSDNVLQEGEVAQSRYGISRRNRTIHARMREYLWEIKHNKELSTSIITIGDGVAISIKK